MSEGNGIVEYKVPTGLVDLTQVSQMLMEQMREVKGNPQAIPQADCMVQVAGRIVDITLAQVKQGQMVLDMIRAKNDRE